MTTTEECKLFIGPMFSEKTTELIRCLKRAIFAEIPCVAIKYHNDNRYGDNSALFTHGDLSLQEKKGLRIIKAKKLKDINLKPDEKVIGIDEGQFYPDLPEMVDKWMKEGRKIYISALDGDFRRKPFGRIPDVIPLCTSVVKLKAICMVCKNNYASYTLRIVKGNDVEMIGSNDKYMAACLKCYLAKYHLSQ